MREQDKFIDAELLLHNFCYIWNFACDECAKH